MHVPAKESGLELLIWRDPGNVDYGVRPIRPIRAIATDTWHRASNQATIVTPVEAEPRSLFPRLVLQVSGLVKILVVVDAEDLRPHRRFADAAHLRLEKSRSHVRHHHKRG